MFILNILNYPLIDSNYYWHIKSISKDEIKLPRNIFLLTDGEVNDKDGVLNLIENNNSKYRIFSIGIGNDFDEDLIKNAGIIGRGNYNFCPDLNKLLKLPKPVPLYKLCP